MSLTKYHWNDADQARLDRAQSYPELLAVARDVLGRMRKPVGQVCGPITTGGSGFAENVLQLKRAIDALEMQDVEIFNQIPFQLRIQAIRAATNHDGSYDQTLLEEFYLPLFEEGLVQHLYFLPTWQTSEGTRWEHEQAVRLGLQITYL